MSIIQLDKEKCVGCNACVRACPVGDANIARYNADGKLVITIDDEKCIKCGACLKACVHEARSYQDDTERFFQDLSKGKKIAIIVAPSAKVVFDGKWSATLKWIKSCGVTGIYDVSLGADICTWAHLRYVEKHPNVKIISQPCAAVVSYIEKHRQELISNLSPVQSPMACMAIYMKKVLGIQEDIAAISPCIAKIDEFHEIGTIHYNVTMKHLKEYMERHNIDLSGFNRGEEFAFDDKAGLEGSIYPRPGGLMKNLLIHSPEMRVITAEGTDSVYQELDNYGKQKKEDLPDVFDVLNCAMGCNGGPATGSDLHCFTINSVMHAQERSTRKIRKSLTKNGKDQQFEEFDQKLRIEDFIRKYKMQTVSKIEVKEQQIEQVFKELKKETYADKNFDCHACGFETCREMAIAIVQGLNEKENCHQYMMFSIKDERQKVEAINEQVLAISEELKNMFEIMKQEMDTARGEAVGIGQAGDKSLKEMENVTGRMEQLKGLNQDITVAMGHIGESAEKYKEMTENVEKIAAKINLLSLNAAIEAAKAGEAGRGFNVVATNIRVLSANSKESVGSAKESDEAVNRSMVEVKNALTDFENSFALLFEAIGRTTEEVDNTCISSTRIQEAMKRVESISDKIQQLILQTNEILTK